MLDKLNNLFILRIQIEVKTYSVQKELFQTNSKPRTLSNQVGTKKILFNESGTKLSMANYVMIHIILMEIHSNMARACFGTSI